MEFSLTADFFGHCETWIIFKYKLFSKIHHLMRIRTNLVVTYFVINLLYFRASLKSRFTLITRALILVDLTWGKIFSNFISTLFSGKFRILRRFDELFGFVGMLVNTDVWFSDWNLFYSSQITCVQEIVIYQWFFNFLHFSFSDF